MKRKLFILFILIFFIFNFTSIYGKKISDDKINSEKAIAIDSVSGAVLFDKNANEKAYPASTTKILTAILAIENLDLESDITASSTAINSTPFGSSTIYLKPGETMKAEYLLYGLLVKSGNDVANVLAEEVSGDIDSFVKLMNKKAVEIGCTNTHFTNPHGFHDDNHYTTAEDMAKIMTYCMKNETFRKIVSTQKITLPATNKTSTVRVLINTNKLLNKSYENLYYEYIIGGKTGYTDEARGTFIGYLKKDDKTIIVAVFDGPTDENGNESRFLDTISISNYIFDDFTNETVIKKDSIKFEVIDKNTKKIYTVSLKNDVFSLTDNLKFRNNYTVNLDELKSDYSYNIGDKIGTINIYAKNSDSDYFLTSTEELYITDISEYKEPLNEKIKRILIVLLLLIFFILIMNVFSKKRKNKVKKKSRTKN